MDERYSGIAHAVVDPFAAHFGARLRSAFVQVSVARGDAIWGVSDMDLVLAFDAPTAEDTALKHETARAAHALPGGDALVIQRIWDDRLGQMDAGTRAYWLWSCRHDIEVVHGDAPGAFLPPPPAPADVARLVAPIIRADGEPFVTAGSLDRRGTRQLSKRILQSFALPFVARGEMDYVPPLAVSSLDLPAAVRGHLGSVVAAYREAPELADPRHLQTAWVETWRWVDSALWGPT